MKSFFTILVCLILVSAGCESTSNTGAVGNDTKTPVKTTSNSDSEPDWPNADYSGIKEIGDISGPFKITGTVNNPQMLEGKYYKLFETDGKDMFTIDSTKVKDGKFSFELKNAKIGFYKVGEFRHNASEFIINPNENELALVVTPPRNGVRVSGSAENTAYQAYKTVKRKHASEIKKVQKLKASTEVKLKKIYALEVALKIKQDEMADANSGTYFSKITRRLLSANRGDKNKFWNDIDFTDASLIRSNVFNDRVQDYMRKHGKDGKDGNEGFMNAVDQIYVLAENGGNDELKAHILYVMMEGFYSSNMKECSSYVIDYITDGCGNSNASERVKMRAAGMKSLEIGETPPDFTINDVNGKSINLSKIASQNDFTLVLFWASWCHKCEQEMPVIKRVYDKYHEKGFEIIGVSVDMNKSDWVNGIKAKECNWINVSQLEQWESPVAKDYRIQSTPVMFLVDSKRELILTPSELKRAHMLETWMNENYK